MVEVVFTGVEEHEQVGKALAGICHSVVLKNQLFEVLGSCFTAEPFEQKGDMCGKQRPVFDYAIDIGQ